MTTVPSPCPARFLLSLVAIEASVHLFAVDGWTHGFLRLAFLLPGLLIGLLLWRAPRPPRTRLPGWAQRRLAAPVCLLLGMAGITAIGAFDWGHGAVQAGLALLAAALLAFVWHAGRRDGERALRLAVAAVIGLLAIQALRSVENSTVTAAMTRRIRLDEGRTSWIAAQLLWRGENPYATGALVDDTAFLARLELRRTAGIGPAMPDADIERSITAYHASLDPRLRQALLPAADGTDLAVREASVLGYKYGPVPLLATAALEPLLGPAAVPLTTGLACLALYAVFGLILYRAGTGTLVTGLAVIALMLDPMLKRYFLFWTATDIWALLFGFIALLCALRGHAAAFGVALALALGSKLVPGALFLGLFGLLPSRRAAGAFMAVSLALYLPWLVWDASGFLHNILLWPTLMRAEENSWVFYAPRWLVTSARLVLVAGMLVFGLRVFLRREPRVCAAMAVVNVLLVMGASATWGNYITWYSTWLVLAAVETFCLETPLAGRIMQQQPGATA